MVGEAVAVAVVVVEAVVVAVAVEATAAVAVVAHDPPTIMCRVETSTVVVAAVVNFLFNSCNGSKIIIEKS